MTCPIASYFGRGTSLSGAAWAAGPQSAGTPCYSHRGSETSGMCSRRTFVASVRTASCTVAGILLITGALSCGRRGAERAQPAASAVATQASPDRSAVGFERLVGRWLRADGGYVLEIRAVTPEGRVEVRNARRWARACALAPVRLHLREMTQGRRRPRRYRQRHGYAPAMYCRKAHLERSECRLRGGDGIDCAQPRPEVGFRGRQVKVGLEI